MSADQASVMAFAADDATRGVVDAVAERTRMLELTEALRDVDQGLDELATYLERGLALPIETAARLRLLQRRARTAPDGASYVGRPA